jgi:hypothetical protein
MIVTRGGRREEHTLTDRELLDVYQQDFGMELTRLPPVS